MKRFFLKRFIEKRIWIFLAAAALVFSVPVHADIIYEPPDNFYVKHVNECTTTYYWNTYKVTSEKAVTAVVSPEDDTPMHELQPDECFSTNTVYQKDGESWYYLPDFDNQMEGCWLYSEGIERLYDAELFEQDHNEDIRGSAKLDISELDEITVCAYPGGRVIETESLNFQKNNQADKTLSFAKKYTDADGKIWGYLGYFYGTVNGWVCIDDPNLADTKVDGILTVSEVRGAESGKDEDVSVNNEESSEKEETSPSDQETAKETTAEKTDEKTQEETTAEETQAPEKKDAIRPKPLLITGILAGAAVLAAALIMLRVLKKKK